MLDHVGLQAAGRAKRPAAGCRLRLELPAELPLEQPRPGLGPARRRRSTCCGRPVPSVPAARRPAGRDLGGGRPATTSPTRGSRWRASSPTPDEPPYEVLVVDNGSTDPTRQYLEVLAARNRHVHVIRNERNLGFAAGCNEGLAAAKSEILVLLERRRARRPAAGSPTSRAISTIPGRAGRRRPPISAAATRRCRASYATYGGDACGSRACAARSSRATRLRRSKLADVSCVGIAPRRVRGGRPSRGTHRGRDVEEEYARRVREGGHRVVLRRGRLRAPLRREAGAPAASEQSEAPPIRRPAEAGRGREQHRVSAAASKFSPRSRPGVPIPRRPRADARLEATDSARGLDAASDPRARRSPPSRCRRGKTRGERGRRDARQPRLPPALPREPSSPAPSDPSS